MTENPDQINSKNQTEVAEKAEGFEAPAPQDTQIETIEGLESLVRETEATADNKLSELIVPEEKVTAHNKSVGLDAGTVEQIKTATGVTEKLAEKSLAGTLLRGVFGNKVRAILAGLTIMTGSGQAKEQFAGTISNTPESSEVQTDSVSEKSEEVDIKPEDEIGRQKIPGNEELAEDVRVNTTEGEKESIISSEFYEDSKKDGNPLNFEETNNFYERKKVKAETLAEKIREELIQHFSSQDFLDRLKIEYDGNEEKARAVQIKDIENLQTVTVDLLTVFDIGKKNKGKEDNHPKDGTVSGFYDNNDHEITAPIDLSFYKTEKTEEEVIRHEFIHAATKGSVSDNARKILSDSYSAKNNGFLGFFKSDEDRYHRNPSERLVRKQILDKELEDLGIKKYGEPFTEEHFKQMMEAYKAGKFSQNAREFIERTKPESFKDIMDKIAVDETEEIKANSAEEIPA